MKSKVPFVVFTSVSILTACGGGGDGSSATKYQIGGNGSTVKFVVVDTGQDSCYNAITQISCTSDFEGQDAEYDGPQPAYKNNGDQTITDLNTGLMWSAVTMYHIEFDNAALVAETSNHAGYNDWRVPTIKELYSLIDFRGETGTSSTDAKPYINTSYFDHSYFSSGSRYIDSQYISSTEYVSKVFNGQAAFFGVNFADGRIKGYPQQQPVPDSDGWNLRLVRGNEVFENEFVDNGNLTITDRATGLIWMQKDSGFYTATAGTQGDGSMNWEEALQWCYNLSLANNTDWRLPNAKEMQSIVDYSRSPATSGTAAIDPLFEITTILDPEGEVQYPYFWTSTTHLDGANPGNYAVYIAFGEAQGRMNPQTQQTGEDQPLYDVHGAGAQRSDPKSGSINDYPQYHGPQGDVLYVYNYARCVRN